MNKPFMALQLQNIEGWCVSPHILVWSERIMKISPLVGGRPSRRSRFQVPSWTPVWTVERGLAVSSVRFPVGHLADFTAVLWYMSIHYTNPEVSIHAQQPVYSRRRLVCQDSHSVRIRKRSLHNDASKFDSLPWWQSNGWCYVVRLYIVWI